MMDNYRPNQIVALQKENENLRVRLAEIRDRELHDGDNTKELRKEIKRLREHNIKLAQWDAKREDLVLKLKELLRVRNITSESIQQIGHKTARRYLDYAARVWLSGGKQ